MAFIGIFFLLRIPKPDTTMKEKLKTVDYLGVTTVLIANILLLLACAWGGNDYPWNSPAVISCFVLAGIWAAAFIFVEFKVAKDPIVPPRLFYIRNNVFANISNFCQGFITYGCVAHAARLI